MWVTIKYLYVYVYKIIRMQRICRNCFNCFIVYCRWRHKWLMSYHIPKILLKCFLLHKLHRWVGNLRWTVFRWIQRDSHKKRSLDRSLVSMSFQHVTLRDKVSLLISSKRTVEWMTPAWRALIRGNARRRTYRNWRNFVENPQNTSPLEERRTGKFERNRQRRAFLDLRRMPAWF